MKPSRADLEQRRERVQRVNVKRPIVVVRARYQPAPIPSIWDRLADLAIELVEEQRRSRGK